MTSESEIYDRGFFEYEHETAKKSAAVVWKWIRDTFGGFHSVVDVGCGRGAWLEQSGIRRHVGIDGDYVTDVVIPKQNFHVMDLSKPYELEEKFDIALCLEVAEHIPIPSAPTFIDSLCKLAPLVVFSAAAPMQGGQGHVNERWPGYWIGHFGRNSYRASGYLRFAMWRQTEISYWYRQNILVFAYVGALEKNPRWMAIFDHPWSKFTQAAIHPEGFGEKMGVKWDPHLL